MSVSQLVPVKPGEHSQENAFISSTHVPYTHGFDAHSLMLTLQSPGNPPTHIKHTYELSLSTHTLFWSHGFDAHSSKFTLQSCPVYPGGQSQMNIPKGVLGSQLFEDTQAGIEQLPPLRHGCASQDSNSHMSAL